MRSGWGERSVRKHHPTPLASLATLPLIRAFTPVFDGLWGGEEGPIDNDQHRPMLSRHASTIRDRNAVLIALFADIHANRQAFEACLAHARDQGAERNVLLGD